MQIYNLWIFLYIYIYIYIYERMMMNDEWWMIDDKGIDYRNLFNQNIIYFYTYYNEIDRSATR